MHTHTHNAHITKHIANASIEYDLIAYLDLVIFFIY